MNKIFVSLAVMMFLGGCQSLTQPSSRPPAREEAAPQPAPASPQQPRQAPPQQSQPRQESQSRQQPQPQQEPEPQPVGSFSEETLYSLLVGELAGQRNRFDIALENYAEQAKATEDPGIAERAFRIAEYLGADQAALESVLIWADNAPANLDAQRAAAIQLARNGRYDESMRYMEKVLQAQGDTHFDFLALAAAESDPETRAGLLQSFDRLLAKSPNNNQLLFGKALLLQQNNQPEAALALLEEHPASEQEISLLLLRIHLLQILERSDEALSLLKRGMRQHPEDKRLRLAYARLLVEQDRLDDAKDEFATLVRQFPEDDELRLSMALVCLEAKDWDEAALYLEELIERGSYVDTAHYQLGRVYEERKDPESALIEYALVGPGNHYLPAQLRQTEILLESDRPEEASVRLARARDNQPDYALQLYLIEAEALTNRERLDDAWQVIDRALQQFPDDLNLLYTRAMLAEKRDDLAQLERDLRFIIGREPDNAMALNALGYTLADRTTRYAEAKALIEQAHQLNPEDPAILDSLGWVHFRLGELGEAERLLRQAAERISDHEIAAHLGEVLWARGKQREARKVWAKALEEQPDSAILRSTLLRLTGSETF